MTETNADSLAEQALRVLRQKRAPAAVMLVGDRVAVVANTPADIAIMQGAGGELVGVYTAAVPLEYLAEDIQAAAEAVA